MEQKEMPKVVYKYRVWDNDFHKRILINNEVYFSAPNDFEDKLDCNPPVSYPEGQELFTFFLRNSMEHNNNKNVVWHIWNASVMYRNSPMNKPYELYRIEKENKNDFNKRFGVLSLAKETDNDAMWNKYSDSHRGFCVGFDTYKLFAAIKGGCGDVRYFETLPPIIFAKDSIDDKIIKTIYNKEKKWEFEHEYRFHTRWKNNEIIDRNVRLPLNTIVEIILGRYMPKSFRQEVKDIAKQKHPKARIIEE